MLTKEEIFKRCFDSNRYNLFDIFETMATLVMSINQCNLYKYCMGCTNRQTPVCWDVVPKSDSILIQFPYKKLEGLTIEIVFGERDEGLFNEGVFVRYNTVG